MPLTNVAPARLTQVVQDYHDAGAMSVSTTRQPDGNYEVTARFDDSPSPVSQPPIDISTNSLSWNDPKHPERDDWSIQLLKSITPRISYLEKGDPDGFISGYKTLDQESRAKFWAELLIAVAKFESAWNQRDYYRESDGQWSIGLFQLSIGDQNNYTLSPHIT